MKQVITKNNFSAGELSPTLYTRTDIQQYGNGAKTLKNVIPLVEGGVRKRPGTLFLSAQVGAVRLIPFVVNSDNAFLIVFKPNLVEIVNPKHLKCLKVLFLHTQRVRYMTSSLCSIGMKCISHIVKCQYTAFYVIQPLITGS